MATEECPCPSRENGYCRSEMDNGWINLAAIVGMEVFCLALIPIILMLGTPKGSASNDE